MKWMEPWICTKKEAEDRFNICLGCDKISIMKICKRCGCFMPVKVKIRNAACFDGKWKEIPFSDTGTWLSEDPKWDEDIRD